MKPVKLLKFAASTMVFGVGMIGTGPVGLSAMASASDLSPEAKLAETAAQKAQQALKKQKFDKALIEAEKAVAFAPDRADYRMILGQTYLALGRMSAAETTFGDVVALDPSNGRAGLNRALMQIALGRRENALATLDQHRELLAASDFGLAVALAGDTSGAVKILEAAVRAPGANAKTRQNLALAYVLNGQWAQSRATAALDVSPDQLDPRMMEWAQFSRPTSSSDQVASLMQIRPVYDPGQPERLELVLQPARQVAAAAVAEPIAAAPVIEPAAEMPVLAAQRALSQPVAVAAAAPVTPAPAFEIPAQTVVAAPAVPVASAPSLKVAGPTVVAAPAAPIIRAPAAPIIRAPAAPAKQAVVAVRPAFTRPVSRPIESGRFVVQLGAFSNEGRAQIAWDRAVGKDHALSGYSAATARVQVRGVSLYRLSVAGFATRDDASRVCTRVKAAGGDCFVRSIAGDKPMQWVSRGGTRLAARR